MSALDSVGGPTDAARIDEPPRLGRVSTVRRLLRNPAGLIGGVVCLCLIATAIFAPWIAPHDPNAQEVNVAFLPPSWVHGGHSTYLLGTDKLGRDILSRTIYGASASLLVGVCSVLIALVVGVTLGVLAGYFGGRLEAVIMRLTDIQLAIPYILLAIVVAAAAGPSILTVILVLGGTRWVVYARVCRGEVLSLRHRDFVRAAVSIGLIHRRILWKHILPNLSPAILVLATIEVSIVILAEASLSFLGLGIPPATPSWGSMIADGADYLATGWWLSVFPGVGLMLTVLSTNLLGNALRDVLDPALKTDI